jgi:hypothetical protein
MEGLVHFKVAKKIDTFHFPFLQLLQLEIQSNEQSSIDQLEEKVLLLPAKITCLQLINNIVNGIEGLDQRFLLRNSLWNGGLRELEKVCIDWVMRRLIGDIEFEKAGY